MILHTFNEGTQPMKFTVHHIFSLEPKEEPVKLLRKKILQTKMTN